MYRPSDLTFRYSMTISNDSGYFSSQSETTSKPKPANQSNSSLSSIFCGLKRALKVSSTTREQTANVCEEDAGGLCVEQTSETVQAEIEQAAQTPIKQSPSKSGSGATTSARELERAKSLAPPSIIPVHPSLEHKVTGSRHVTWAPSLEAQRGRTSTRRAPGSIQRRRSPAVSKRASAKRPRTTPKVTPPKRTKTQPIDIPLDWWGRPNHNLAALTTDTDDFGLKYLADGTEAELSVNSFGERIPVEPIVPVRYGVRGSGHVRWEKEDFEEWNWGFGNW